MKLSNKRIAEFQTMIFSWWEDHRRMLPWRHTRDPYTILISEVMLQQTQVERVLSRYAEFIEAYPTVPDLARASLADVLRLWKGMGYNRRALYLKKTAEAIVKEYHGKFPKDEKLLRKLPGVGTYTARAILVFAFGENIAMVDTNIRRIITHYFLHDTPQKEKVVQEIADQLLPPGRSWEWHQALMDFGALGLQSRVKSRERRGTSIPFHQSSRFFRGRVVDELREGPKTEHELKKIADDAIIAGLMKDGLITKRGAVLSLSE